MDEKRTKDDEHPHAILSDAIDAALVELRQCFDQHDFERFYKTLTAMPEAFVFCPAEALNWTEPDQISCLASGAAAFAVASGKTKVVEGRMGQYVILIAGTEADAVAAIAKAAMSIKG